MNTLFFLSYPIRCFYQTLIGQDGLACHETKDGREKGEASDNWELLIGLALLDEYCHEDIPYEMEQDGDQTKGSLTGTLLIYKYGVEAEGRG